MKQLRRWLRYISICALVILISSMILSYAYYRWDDYRVIRVYGGDPAVAQYSGPFLGKYLEQNLKKGMTSTEVRRVIHHFWKDYTFQPMNDPLKFERFLLDPLLSLEVEVSYDNGTFRSFTIERHEIPWLIEIQIISLMACLGFLLLSILPFERFFPTKQ